MLCPNCGYDNIPGLDLCEDCGTDLAGLDLPEASSGLAGRLLTDGIRDVPLAPALTVAPGGTVADAVTRMRDERQGFVLVVENDGLVGILTERDILTRVLRAGRSAGDTTVEQVMTPAPTTLEPEDPPAFAVHRMVAQEFRHLPILRDNEISGVLSIRGVLRYISEHVLAGAEAEAGG